VPQLAQTTISLTEAERERAAGAWIDCRGNKRIPAQEFHHDDGRIEYGQAAIRAGMRWIDSMHAPRRRSPVRTVAIITPRPREHRPGGARRSASSSSTSSSDPGDPDPDDGDGLRHVSIPLADELNRIADRLRARGGVG
jgi:hypothetical protein